MNNTIMHQQNSYETILEVLAGVCSAWTVMLTHAFGIDISIKHIAGHDIEALLNAVLIGAAGYLGTLCMKAVIRYAKNVFSTANTHNIKQFIINLFK